MFSKVKYQLNILILSDDIKNLYTQNNKYHYIGDSGIDLYNNEISVDPFNVETIDFNIKCEMINLETNEFESYYLVPRSSIAKTPFQMANSIGIIDAGYRGNLMAKIRNCTLNRETLRSGSYFQIVSHDLKPIKINIVSELSNTSRDNNGFGSTNKLKVEQNILVNDLQKEFKISIGSTDNVLDEDKYILYFDGACKGNPGKGGSGAVLYKNSKIIWSDSILLDGITTNNRAEYNGLILGLNEAKNRSIKNLIVKGDSKLVIQQMAGKYKINSEGLIPLYEQAINISKYFNQIKFTHIKREYNKKADEIANSKLL